MQPEKKVPDTKQSKVGAKGKNTKKGKDRREIHLAGVGGPVRARNAIDLSAQDGGGLHEGLLGGVVDVKDDWPREALGRAPEQRPCRGDGVLWEGVRQLRDAVVEVLLHNQLASQTRDIK